MLFSSKKSRFSKGFFSIKIMFFLSLLKSADLEAEIHMKIINRIEREDFPCKITVFLEETSSSVKNSMKFQLGILKLTPGLNKIRMKKQVKKPFSRKFANFEKRSIFSGISRFLRFFSNSRELRSSSQISLKPASFSRFSLDSPSLNLPFLRKT